MSEKTEITPEAEVTAQDESQTTPEKPSYEQLETQLKEWKSNSRFNEDRFKALKTKAESWEAYEASQKTEAQKLADELETLKARATAAEQQLAVSKIVSDLKLPASLAKHLRGATQEELEASAKELLEDFGLVSTSSSNTPTESEEVVAKPVVDKTLGAPVKIKVSEGGSIAAALRDTWN